MAATGIWASGYQLTNIPVLGGLFFEYGSLFMHIIEMGTDEGSKMLGFSLGVACGAKKFLHFASTVTLSCFLLFLGGPQTQKVEAFGSNNNGNHQIDETECASGSSKKQIALWVKTHVASDYKATVIAKDSWCN